MKIAAIETKYKGYRFRSRLEARWAVFFDALGIEWLYETEGFNLGEAGLYLPDFYLPKVGDGLWVEIKAVMPTDIEQNKMSALVNHTDKSGTFRCGEPMNNIDISKDSSHDLWDSTGIYVPDGEDIPYFFCLCPWCEKAGFEFDGRGARICGWKKHHKSEDLALNAIKHLGHWRADDKCYTADHEKILDAAIKARSARFEFGEKA